MEIVVGLMFVIVAWYFIKSKSRIHYANKRSAERKIASGEEAPYPSWGTSKNRMDEFAAMLYALAKRRSVPKKFIGGVMTTDYSQNRMLFTAGLMERQGASFEEQTMAVMDQIEKYWNSMDVDERQPFLDEA